MRASITALVTLAALSAGCARPWQAARTVVTSAATAVAAADEAVVAAYQGGHCPRTADPDALRECVAGLEQRTEALRLARDVVLVGESLVDVWQQSGEEPDDWRGWLDDIGQALARIVALLDSAGVDLPAEVTEWAAVIDRYLERRR